MDIKKVLTEAVSEAVQKAIQAGTMKEAKMVPLVFTVPAQKAFGEFATNFALQAARNFHCPPRVIADAVVKYLDCSAVEKMEVAGPGFLNFYLKSDWLYEGLARILEKGESYGNLPKKAGEKIQIEFVSANPTGPLHVGHGRGAAVGSSLANLMLAAGYDVTREYLINDAGNQIQKFGKSLAIRYLQLYKGEEAVPCRKNATRALTL